MYDIDNRRWMIAPEADFFLREDQVNPQPAQALMIDNVPLHSIIEYADFP